MLRRHSLQTIIIHHLSSHFIKFKSEREVEPRFELGHVTLATGPEVEVMARRGAGFAKSRQQPSLLHHHSAHLNLTKSIHATLESESIEFAVNYNPLSLPKDLTDGPPPRITPT